jgi:hypothetical protein
MRNDNDKSQTYRTFELNCSWDNNENVILRHCALRMLTIEVHGFRERCKKMSLYE